MKEISITLPLPSRDLSPNSRCHWSAKSRETKRQRQIAHFMARAEIQPRHEPWETADVKIVVTFPDRRNRDKDNVLASLKSAFDGVQDSGLIKNDSGLSFLPIEFTEPDKLNSGVVITFTKTTS